MNRAESRTSRPITLTIRSMVPAISLILLLCVLSGVLFVALKAPMKDDIAWLLYVARRWMAGRELYVDVIEVNPPLIVWISSVPLAIADWLGVAARWVVMPVFSAMVLACAWWSAMLLRARGGLLAHSMPVFAIIGSVLLLLPGDDLAQREHLLVAAFLPYLVLFARSLDGQHVPPLAAICAGILAGLGCGLKPQYAAVFVALEGLALTHGLRPWRLMPLAAGAILLAYAGAVALLCPAYLQRAVPMAIALYGATDVTLLSLLHDSAALLGGEAAAIALLVLYRRSMNNYSLMLSLLVFAVVSTLIYFWDGKDWFYHRLPAYVVTWLALLLWTASINVSLRWAPRLPLLAASLAAGMFCLSSVQQVEPEMVDALEAQENVADRLELILRAEHAHTYVAFSEWLSLGFPVVNNTGVTWASRFDSMWALKGEVWRTRFDPQTAKEWPIGRWVAHDFIAGCPDIAVVDTRETTPYIKVLSEADPAFARVWTRYRPISAFEGLVVYKRSRAGCLDMWVAVDAKPVVKTR
jgi:hypothetical protein